MTDDVVNKMRMAAEELVERGYAVVTGVVG